MIRGYVHSHFDALSAHADHGGGSRAVADRRHTGDVSQRLKLYAALLMFQAGELSARAACELAGVDRFTFLAECHRRAIPVINYSPAELREEVESLRRQRAG
jgi:predicted HTH domain antitoxin